MLLCLVCSPDQLVMLKLCNNPWRLCTCVEAGTLLYFLKIHKSFPSHGLPSSSALLTPHTTHGRLLEKPQTYVVSPNNSLDRSHCRKFVVPLLFFFIYECSSIIRDEGVLTSTGCEWNMFCHSYIWCTRAVRRSGCRRQPSAVNIFVAS
jgi:hypothetical protein